LTLSSSCPVIYTYKVCSSYVSIFIPLFVAQCFSTEMVVTQNPFHSRV
jgi:hypothetical protein